MWLLRYPSNAIMPILPHRAGSDRNLRHRQIDLMRYTRLQHLPISHPWQLRHHSITRLRDVRPLRQFCGGGFLAYSIPSDSFEGPKTLLSCLIRLRPKEDRRNDKSRTNHSASNSTIRNATSIFPFITCREIAITRTITRYRNIRRKQLSGENIRGIPGVLFK